MINTVSRSISRIEIYAALLLATIFLTPVVAMTPLVLIDSALESHRVHIQSLVDGTISYFDSDRHLQVESVHRYVQLRDIGGFGQGGPYQDDRVTVVSSQDNGQFGVIELVDGQRLIGQWIGSDERAQKIVWRHPNLGEVALSLDQLAVIRSSGGSPTPSIPSPPPVEDQVELVNGDTLFGFVTGLSAGGMTFQTRTDELSVVLPIKRVRAMILANTRIRRGSDCHMVWLLDGSRVMTRSIRIESDQLAIDSVLKDETSIQPIPMAQVMRIDLASDGRYLIDLADLPMRVTGGGTVLGLTYNPVTVGTSIWMHAPVSVCYELPAGSERLSTTAMLVTGSEPAQAADWADFELVIRINGQDLSRSRLNPMQPTAQINSAVHSGPLTIELDPAANGPLMDRMLLRDAVVFVQPSGAGQ